MFCFLLAIQCFKIETIFFYVLATLDKPNQIWTLVNNVQIWVLICNLLVNRLTNVYDLGHDCAVDCMG